VTTRAQPSGADRLRSAASADASATRLEAAVLPLASAHPGLCGLVPLSDGRDAFAARALLADAAERTLDAQYYIWHNDMSGTLLLDALRRAADRGVHIRLLLDDNNTRGLDETLAAFDAHANIEVRLFNPFRHRRARWLDYLTNFARLNRRMHNKSFTVDGQVTIVGGRNVGDEYFATGHDVAFVDVDVLAIGSVVSDVSRDFERYWASDSSQPAAGVLPAASTASIASASAATARVAGDPNSVAYVEALARQPFVRELLSGTLRFQWAATTMVSDDPAKALGRATKDGLVWSRLKDLMGAPGGEMYLISPYFVPAGSALDYFAGLARRGVKVVALTNSLEATDVTAVHAGYSKRRRRLLASGVTLFELKRVSTARSGRRRMLLGSSGSSHSSLHAKTFSIDRSRVFIGSFNFDPRSARLNTELGFVMDSPALAQAIADAFAETIPQRAYSVGLRDGATLQWTESRDGRVVVHAQEPGAGLGLRFAVAVMSVLPIDWLL
jgi:cardiolipin synthase C